MEPTPPGTDSKREPSFSRRYILLLALAAAALYVLAGGFGAEGRTISYGEFKAHLARGEVREVWIAEDDIRGFLHPPDAGAEPGGVADVPEEAPAPSLEHRFRCVRVEDPDLVGELEAAGVEFTGVKPNTTLGLLLTWLVPLALMGVLLVWIMRSVGRAGSQTMGFGRSKARLVPETGTGVTFEDVAGCDEAKAQLQEMVEFLRNPQRFRRVGARIPRGVLLLGPPGTGKTLLARAVAGEAAVPFFSINGSDFVEMFVGVGAARVRDLFVQAKEKAPCIVFVDEIDAVGRQRGVSMGVVNDEREQTLNQLLSEMDGFEADSGVILLAATNRPEVLDAALLRPGRFDRQVVLDAPDVVGREAILAVHARGKPLADDVDLAKVAQATPGMSGADLANALNEAALWTALQGRDEIRQADIEEAVEKVVVGPERRSRRLLDDEKRRIAFHEAGHALVAAKCEHADPVRKISIVPRGRAALGYTLQLPEQEQYLKTESELRDRLRALLGGRAAEELVLGEASTGAADDLRSATALARQMVLLFGMSERLGLPQGAQATDGRYSGGPFTMQRDCSEATAREADEEVQALLAAAYQDALEILTRHRAELDAVVDELLRRETLDGTAFDRLIGRVPGAEAPAAVPAS